MKQKISIVLLTCLLLTTLAACGNSNTNQPPEPEPAASVEDTESEITDVGNDNSGEEESEDTAESEQELEPEGPSTLVVFFSRHRNNLKGVDAVTSASLSSNDVTILADMIVENTGKADLHQIITVDPYPTDYTESTEVARTELDEDARPALANSVDNMEQYDVIYLGYPNWWGTIPMPVATFLESYDFSGKIIVPFCTHEGSGLGSSEEHIARLVPSATVLGGFEISGNQAASAQDSIADWMSGLDLLD